MDHKTNDISLVVVDAVAPDIEEDPGTLYPGAENYAAARKILKRILTS